MHDTLSLVLVQITLFKRKERNISGIYTYIHRYIIYIHWWWDMYTGEGRYTFNNRNQIMINSVTTVLKAFLKNKNY